MEKHTCNFSAQEEEKSPPKKIKIEKKFENVKKEQLSPIPGKSKQFKSEVCYDKDVKPKLESTTSKIKTEHLWKDYELLTEFQNIDEHVAKNLINLFEEGNTIPFIARYRRNLVNNMNPDDLRDVKEAYDKINLLKEKSKSIIKSLEKTGHLNEIIKTTILSSRSIEEIEHIVCGFMRITR